MDFDDISVSLDREFITTDHDHTPDEYIDGTSEIVTPEIITPDDDFFDAKLLDTDSRLILNPQKSQTIHEVRK
jgi:hypothetical protein